jgi:hypothetical protein
MPGCTRSGATNRHLGHDYAEIWPLHACSRILAGAARVQREIALPAAWNRAWLELVAFVQDARSGGVLQALSTQQCAGF